MMLGNMSKRSHIFLWKPIINISHSRFDGQLTSICQSKKSSRLRCTCTRWFYDICRCGYTMIGFWNILYLWGCDVLAFWSIAIVLLHFQVVRIVHRTVFYIAATKIYLSTKCKEIDYIYWLLNFSIHVHDQCVCIHVQEQCVCIRVHEKCTCTWTMCMYTWCLMCLSILGIGIDKAHNKQATTMASLAQLQRAYRTLEQPLWLRIIISHNGLDK